MIQYTIERLSSCVSNYCHTCEFVENWFSLNDSSVTRAKIQKISGRTQPQSEMLAVLSYVERQDVAIFCMFRMRLCWKHFCFSGSDYWKVKNFWGPDWGENGYARIARGFGHCGIGSYVMQPTCRS